MIELGADGMSGMKQKALMINLFRGLAIAMIPLTYTFPAVGKNTNITYISYFYHPQ